MEQVRIDREGRLAALVLGDGDLVLLGELDQLAAAGEIPFAPRGDDLDVRRERVIAELEADLVVAFAGGAVADRVGIDLARDLDLALGDQGPRDAGAEQVQPLVERVGAHHREHVVADEFLLHVVDEDVFGFDPGLFRLAPCGFELLALAEVGGEGHDLALIGLLEPFQDDAGVEAARISEDDAIDGL